MKSSVIENDCPLCAPDAQMLPAVLEVAVPWRGPMGTDLNCTIATVNGSHVRTPNTEKMLFKISHPSTARLSEGTLHT
jgi:hypothetical protein